MAFAVAKDVEFGGTYTYDDAFNARASADLTIRFGGGSHKEKSKQQAKAEEQPQIKELSATPSNRDVRVQDAVVCTPESVGPNPIVMGKSQLIPFGHLKLANGLYRKMGFFSDHPGTRGMFDQLKSK